MHIEESGFEQAVLLCGEKLGYVHIGESHRCPVCCLVKAPACLAPCKQRLVAPTACRRERRCQSGPLLTLVAVIR
jgi:hypothetical protein